MNEKTLPNLNGLYTPFGSPVIGGEQPSKGGLLDKCYKPCYENTPHILTDISC